MDSCFDNLLTIHHATVANVNADNLEQGLQMEDTGLPFSIFNYQFSIPHFHGRRPLFVNA
jgi:hypothetical protein